MSFSTALLTLNLDRPGAKMVSFLIAERPYHAGHHEDHDHEHTDRRAKE
jgi:hypothetical protein